MDLAVENSPVSLSTSVVQRDWYFIAEQPAPAPHLAYPEGCAALRIVLAVVEGEDRNHWNSSS